MQKKYNRCKKLKTIKKRKEKNGKFHRTAKA